MKKIALTVFSLFILSVCSSSIFALGPVNPADPDQVAELKREADSGDRGAQYDMSMVYEFQQKKMESLKYLQMSAENGYGRAQYTLGNMYYYGSGGVTKNYAEAEKWFSASKNSGFQGRNVDALIADSADKAVLAAKEPAKPKPVVAAAMAKKTQAKTTVAAKKGQVSAKAKQAKDSKSKVIAKKDKAKAKVAASAENKKKQAATNKAVENKKQSITNSINAVFGASALK